jgi:hypothetical protein
VSVEQEAIGRLVRKLEALGIPYMVAGSVASSHHGLPRATNDADIVVDPAPQDLDRLVAALLSEGYYADARIAREALRTRRLFNVIDPETAFKIDLIIRKERPFSREEFSRREHHDFAGLSISIATAEDTIVSKLEWARKAGGSERQLEDVLGILLVCGDRLDREYVEKWAAGLGVLDLWRAVLDRHASSQPNRT